HGDADDVADARDLLEHHRVRLVIETGTAVLGRDDPAEQPEPGRVLDDLDREALLAVVVGDMRSDLPPREVTRERDQVLLLCAQREIHAARVASLPIAW